MDETDTAHSRLNSMLSGALPTFLSCCWLLLLLLINSCCHRSPRKKDREFMAMMASLLSISVVLDVKKKLKEIKGTEKR